MTDEQMRVQAAIDRLFEIIPESKLSPEEQALMQQAIDDLKAGRGVRYRDRVTGQVLPQRIKGFGTGELA
jgi:hypothetical protein